MAKEDRGTKREDPETGKKFYDLNRDPIVSPYTGKSYPRSFFEQNAPVRAKAAPEPEEDEDEDEIEEAAPGAPEIVSLEEADAEEAADDEVPAEVEDVEEVEDLGDDDADVFLEEDEDEDEDLDFGGGDSDER